MNNLNELIESLLQETCAVESELKRVRESIHSYLERVEGVRHYLGGLSRSDSAGSSVTSNLGRRESKLLKLSENERRILLLIGDGMSNKSIGSKIHVSEKTVRNYVSSILLKLEVSNRTEAATYLSRLPGRTRF